MTKRKDGGVMSVVFELVRDPWLPAVYAGIIMMVRGGSLLVCQCTERNRRKKGGDGMSWDYFALFAIVALLFWGLGAFAAWRGKRPVVVYTLTCLGLAVFF